MSLRQEGLGVTGGDTRWVRGLSPEEQRKQWGVTDLQFMSTLFLSRESFTFIQWSA